MPPTRNVSWLCFVNTIQMLLPHSLLPHGRSWGNSGTLISPNSIPSWLTGILTSALLQGFPPICYAPSCFPWNSRSLLIPNGLLTLNRTISMPSFLASLSAIPLVPGLFMISIADSGFPIKITFLIRSTLKRKSLKNRAKWEKNSSCGKSYC